MLFNASAGESVEGVINIIEYIFPDLRLTLSLVFKLAESLYTLT